MTPLWIVSAYLGIHYSEDSYLFSVFRIPKTVFCLSSKDSTNNDEEQLAAACSHRAYVYSIFRVVLLLWMFCFNLDYVLVFSAMAYTYNMSLWNVGIFPKLGNNKTGVRDTDVQMGRWVDQEVIHVNIVPTVPCYERNAAGRLKVYFGSRFSHPRNRFVHLEYMYTIGAEGSGNRCRSPFPWSLYKISS